MNSGGITEAMIPTYGVSAKTADDAGIVETIARDGFALIDSGIGAEELSILSSELERIYKLQIDEVSLQTLEKCNDLDVVRCALAYSHHFLEVALNQSLLDTARKLLGPNFTLLQQNGLLNSPERPHYQLRWHRDLAYQHWVSSKVLSIAALLCVDEFNAETGGTHVLPGSHLIEEFPSDDYVLGAERQISAAPGTFIVMNAMLYHRAGMNNSASCRRGINHLIGLPFMAQQINLPAVLGKDVPTDSFQAGYLGYTWGPSANVVEWRNSRARGL
jgi:hypothetical protein